MIGMVSRYPRDLEALASMITLWREHHVNPIHFYQWNEQEGCYTSGVNMDERLCDLLGYGDENDS